MTLAYYPPASEGTDEQTPHSGFQLAPADMASSLSKSEQWAVLNARFCETLSDEWHARRVGYRAFVINAVKSLKVLDGLQTKKERPGYERLVGQWEAKKARVSAAGAVEEVPVEN